MRYLEKLATSGLTPLETKYREGDGKKTPDVSIIEVPLPFEKKPGLNKLVVRRIEGPLRGFAISLNAGAHGDEVTSVDTVFEIAKRTTKDLISGSVTALAVANPRAVLKESTRGVIYVRGRGRQDLNRHFTVADNRKEKGIPRIPARRLGRAIRDIHRATFAANAGKNEEIYRHPDYPAIVLDFHTENDNESSREDVIPYIRMDNTPDDKLLGFMIYCAEVMGLPWVLEYPPDEYVKEGLDGSLTSVLINHRYTNHRVPAFAIELGPGGRVDNHYRALGIAAVQNLMAHFKMRDSDRQLNYQGSWWQHPSRQLGEFEKIFPIHKTPLQLRDAKWVDGKNKSIRTYDKFHINVKPGDLVYSRDSGGQPIGHIDPIDSLDEEENIPIYADISGYVLSAIGTEIYGALKDGIAYLAAAEIADPEIRDRVTRIQQEQISKLDEGILPEIPSEKIEAPVQSQTEPLTDVVV